MIKQISNLELLNLIESESNLELFDFFNKEWLEKKSLTIGFIYFSILVNIKNSDKIRSNFNAYDFLLPDGIGLNLYFKHVFKNNVKNLNGSDLLPEYIKYMESKSIKYAFYGAISKNITDCSKKQKPYYFQDGYSELDWENIEDNSCLILGLGLNKQEEFILENQDIIKEKGLLIISGGGFFDFCSGNVKRAPLWIRKIKLEFLYRLAIDPKRHIKKNLLNFYLFYLILKDKRKVIH